MSHKGWRDAHVAQVNEYLDLLRARARGQLPSGARFLRDFVLNHPEYKHDSVLTEGISYDLMKLVDALENPESPEFRAARSKLLGPER